MDSTQYSYLPAQNRIRNRFFPEWKTVNKLIGLGFLFLLIAALPLAAQTDSLTVTDSVTTSSDSLNPDSTFSKLLQKFGVRDTSVADGERDTLVNSPTGVIVSGDTVLEKKKKRKKLKRGTPEYDAWAKSLDPNVAYKRSLMLPGLGQAYNRSYWKIPIVYAGFGALGYFIVDNHQQYKEFQTAYRCRLDTNCTDNYPGIRNDKLVEARDYYRRNRDFTIILSVLWYGINTVDAYVEAHLKYFDVSDDLSIQLKPTLMTAYGRQQPVIPGAGLTFRLK